MLGFIIGTNVSFENRVINTNLKGMLMLGFIIGDKHSLWELTPGQLRATSTIAEASIRPYPNLKSMVS